MARKAVKTTKPKAPAPNAGLSKQDLVDVATTVVSTLQSTGLVGPQASKTEKDEELQVIDDARKMIIMRVAKYGPSFKTIKQGNHRKTINTDAVGMNMINKMEQDKDQWT